MGGDLLKGRDLVRIVAVVGQVVAVFAFWELLSHRSQIGIGFLYAIPVTCAGWWYGRRAGAAAALVCLVIYVVSAAAAGVPTLAASGSLRGLVLLGVGMAAGYAHELTLRARETTSELDAIRQALTPTRLPEIPGLDVAAALMPAEHAVAGDFYLLTNAPGGWSVAIVGDVVGHGLAAARMATFTRISLISIISGSADPAQILKLANRAVHTRTEGTGEYVTATCVAYHPDEPAVRWASAGHPLPIALPHAEELQPIRYATPLGLNAELDVTGQHAPLSTADAILLYTDGLYEARGSDGRFGLDRVLAAVSTATAPTAAEIVAAVRSAVREFADQSLGDDICIVALRRELLVTA